MNSSDDESTVIGAELEPSPTRSKWSVAPACCTLALPKVWLMSGMLEALSSPDLVAVPCMIRSFNYDNRWVYSYLMWLFRALPSKPYHWQHVARDVRDSGYDHQNVESNPLYS